MRLEQYINEGKSPGKKGEEAYIEDEYHDTVTTIKGKTEQQINWTRLFDRFGGYKKFLKASGLDDKHVKMSISTGEPNKKAREAIRRAVAKDIIKNGAKVTDTKKTVDQHMKS